MFIHKTGGKDILILKHLEICFLNNLSNEEYAALKRNYFIGLYFGGNYVGDIIHSPDFYICIPGLNNHLSSRLDKIPSLRLSGFNFLPEVSGISFVYPETIKCDVNYLLYIGDFYPRKGLADALKFFRSQTELDGVLMVRVSSIGEKLLAIILRQLLFYKSKSKVTLLLPKTGLNHARKDIFRMMKYSAAIIMPYKNEGAARVFAEAELLGKPIIYNQNMKGGTLYFQNENENLMLNNYSDRKLSNLSVKNKLQKKQIYCSKYRIEDYRNFLSKNFNIDIMLSSDELINAFSGHRNNLPSEFTNSLNDEIHDFKSWYRFLASNQIVNQRRKRSFVILLKRSIKIANQRVSKLFHYLKVCYEISKY